MPATQSRSDNSLSANFVQQFDQVQEQAKSVFAAQKELLDALEQINEHWFAPNQKLSSSLPWPINSQLYGPCPI